MGPHRERVKVETRGRGVLLPDLKLALDTSAPGFESVVSHAHGDHIPWDARHAWASPETADLLAIRKPDLRVTTLPWREPAKVGRAKVTLLPAGHILGSALTLVESPEGERLLYTADTKTRPALTTPTAEFPEAEALRATAARWAKETIAAGEVPVFLGYALGKGQELLAILHEGGVPTVAHG